MSNIELDAVGLGHQFEPSQVCGVTWDAVPEQSWFLKLRRTSAFRPATSAPAAPPCKRNLQQGRVGTGCRRRRECAVFLTTELPNFRATKQSAIQVTLLETESRVTWSIIIESSQVAKTGGLNFQVTDGTQFQVTVTDVIKTAFNCEPAAVGHGAAVGRRSGHVTRAGTLSSPGQAAVT